MVIVIHLNIENGVLVIAMKEMIRKVDVPMRFHMDVAVVIFASEDTMLKTLNLKKNLRNKIFYISVHHVSICRRR